MDCKIVGTTGELCGCVEEGTMLNWYIIEPDGTRGALQSSQ